MPNFTRRAALAGIASISATGCPGSASALSGPPEPAELPNVRCARLMAQLSDALNDYDRGRWHAEVYPSAHHDYPAGFVNTRLRRETDLELRMLGLQAGAYRRLYWAAREAVAKDAPDRQRRCAASGEAHRELMALVVGQPPIATW